MPRTEPSAPQHQRVLDSLRKYGWNATSFQVLEPDLAYWFDAQDNCVAYLDTGRAWVVAGAPIAPTAALAAVCDAFCLAAKSAGRRVAFFATEQRFVDAADCQALIIGEQPIWDPAGWSDIVGSTKNLRAQLNRASNKGVAVRRVDASELDAPNAALRLAIQTLIARWLAHKPLPAMGFLVQVDPFTFIRERRMFVAMQGDRLVGFAAVVPIFARNGWLIEDLIRSPAAPNGTVELLVDAAMRDAASLHSDYVTLGLAPLAGPISDWLYRARRLGSGLFDFSALEAYKARFRPEHWSPIYLAYPRGKKPIVAIYDSLSAFAHGHLFRFALRALLRGPDIVLRLLAALLIPWTLFLAWIDTERWFLIAPLKWFWVTFDVVLTVALFAMTTRHRQKISTALLTMLIFDALATPLQAIWLDWRRVTLPFEGLALVTAILAPVFALVVVFNVRARTAFPSHERQ